MNRKIQKTSLPTGSEINRYTPCDYMDTFKLAISLDRAITPMELMNSFWCDQPAWIVFLFKLRNWLVKPFGLSTGDEKEKPDFQESLRKGESNNLYTTLVQTDKEFIMSLDDKHLIAYLSIYIEPDEKEGQNIYVITVVHYHYWLGKAYFTAIKPFHKIIVYQLLKRIGKKIERQL